MPIVSGLTMDWRTDTEKVVSFEPAMSQRLTVLFSDVYTLLHRRHYPQGIPLTPEGRGLLLHLAWSGPLTIGDLALHTQRAQSVVSESVAVLESHEMLARVRDPRDRRRTLVWLTERARNWLAEEQEPLDRERTAAVLEAMSESERNQLFDALGCLVATAQRLRAADAERQTTEVAPSKPNKAKGK